MALLEQTPVMSAAALNPNDLLSSLNYVEAPVLGSSISSNSLYQIPTTDHIDAANIHPTQDFEEPKDSTPVHVEAPVCDKVTDGAALDITSIANRERQHQRISFEGLSRILVPPISPQLTHI